MQKDYLELLEMIEKGVKPSELRKHFINDKDCNDFFVRAIENGDIRLYLNPDHTTTTRLTPEGQSYLKEKIQKWYMRPEWWGIIVSGLIGAAGLAVALFKP